MRRQHWGYVVMVNQSFVQKYNLSWTNLFLTSWSQEALRARYEEVRENRPNYPPILHECQVTKEIVYCDVKGSGGHFCLNCWTEMECDFVLGRHFNRPAQPGGQPSPPGRLANWLGEKYPPDSCFFPQSCRLIEQFASLSLPSRPSSEWLTPLV